MPEKVTINTLFEAAYAAGWKGWPPPKGGQKPVDTPQPPIVEEVYTMKELDEMTFPDSDPRVLLGTRFLSRGQACILVAPSHHGKSVLAEQIGIEAAMGRRDDNAILKPSKAMRVLLIQAENDPQDLQEHIHGIKKYLSKLLFENQNYDEVSDRFITITTSCVSGDAFGPYLDAKIREHKPDLVIVDNALSYIGGDASNQEVVGKWTRNVIQPLLQKHMVGLLLVQHTGKLNEWKVEKVNQFNIFGSVEWSNWARGILVLCRHSTKADAYHLVAVKRGAHSGWLIPQRNNPRANYQERMLMRGGDDGVYWRPPTEAEWHALAGT